MAGIGQYKMIKLFETTVTADSNGDNKETQVVRAKLYADVTDLGGSRTMDHQQLKLSTTKQFKVWWRPDWKINQNWQLKYFGQMYSISKIERIGEKRFNWLITANAKS